MKKVVAVFLIFLVSGCATKAPPPPDPVGEVSPINVHHPVTGEVLNYAGS